MGDVRMLTYGNNWTKEEELDVEAQLLLENSGPLCLDPDVAVSIITNSIEYYKNPFASQSLRILSKIRRKFALKQISHKKYLAPVETKLLDFIEENELPSVGKEVLKDDVFKYENPPLIESVPHSIAPYLKRRILKVVGDSSSVFSLRPIEVEEFVFEYETLKDGDVQIMRDKLVITQTPHDGFYHGILHPCEKAHSRNSKNFFCLGSRSNLDLYICQLTRTLSDSFSRYIKVLHRGLESSSKMNGEEIEGRVVFTAGIKLSEDSEDDSQIMDMSVDNEQISVQPSRPINVNPSGSTEVEYSSNPSYFASSESTLVEGTTDDDDNSPNDVVSIPSANEIPVFLHRPYQMSYYSDSNNDGF
ncbi:transcription factor SPT20 homolog isoform X2 [Stegodyphus dumicola]|uniref:transcription factor SPT20 homolog isoform X2 n=1 Tax=Stegodyphus dumicola TaxID=202533 RepID=UPI0015A98FFC|nr:transcription factor SPT20 homolog isoform X2 [Stegodyphus dumicola]